MQVAQRINRERAVVLGWGRAILLQVAHPLVAAGVAGHSGFAASRWARVDRLHATVATMLELTFGDDARQAAAAARINAIHDRVHGRLQNAVGQYPAGSPYSATDPVLLGWVHATLLDSMPLAYEQFVGPLTDEERDRYCQESVESGRRLRIPEERLPRRAAEVRRELDARVHDGTIVVGDEARTVARQLLYPPVADPTRPVAWLNRLVTVGLLPAPVREAYGFTWSAGNDRALRAVSSTIRRALPLLPGVVRYWRT
jgi:uncharacterized protein (DUF2236 family)